jgi:hypothetical protein
MSTPTTSVAAEVGDERIPKKARTEKSSETQDSDVELKHQEQSGPQQQQQQQNQHSSSVRHSCFVTAMLQIFPLQDLEEMSQRGDEAWERQAQKRPLPALQASSRYDNRTDFYNT